jgi:hypothetical protein
MAGSSLRAVRSEARAISVPVAALAAGDPTGGAVLALDLGQKTGWAVRNADSAIASGTVEFKPGRFESGGMVFLRFRAWLQEVDELRAAPGPHWRCCIGLWPREIGNEGPSTSCSRRPPSSTDAAARTDNRRSCLSTWPGAGAWSSVSTSRPRKRCCAWSTLRSPGSLTIQGTSTASSTSEATPAAWRSFCPMREFRSHLSRQGAKSIDAEAEKPLGWREHGIQHASSEAGA